MHKYLEHIVGSKEKDYYHYSEGFLLKYVVEYYDDIDELVKIGNVYLRLYLSDQELRSTKKIADGNLSVVIRGPFELCEGALEDSKIERYMVEKKDSGEDVSAIDIHKSVAYSQGSKYVYFFFSEVMTVKRLMDCKYSKIAYSTDKIKEIASSIKGENKTALRVNVLNNKEKKYLRLF